MLRLRRRASAGPDRAARPDVWRAVTYDHWDGEAWSRATDDTAEVDGGDVLAGVGDPGRVFADSTLTQSVTVLALTSGVLVAAAQPFYVVSANGTVAAGPDASLFPVPFLRRGMRYAVTSDLLRSSADALRDTKGEVPRDVADLYLQLPQVPARVRA
ncbi:MAG: transglutaminaseTgpA domain-containing protein, partial [Vicinamibacterales bacterium]